jgi:hypothetical protein
MICTCCKQDTPDLYSSYSRESGEFISTEYTKCLACLRQEKYEKSDPTVDGKFFYFFPIGFFASFLTMTPFVLIFFAINSVVEIPPNSPAIMFPFVWLVTSIYLINRKSHKQMLDNADSFINVLRNNHEKAVALQKDHLESKKKEASFTGHIQVPVFPEPPSQPSPPGGTTDFTDESELMRLGYKITGLTDNQRWNILVNNVLPKVQLYDIARIISGHIYGRRLQYNGDVKYANAIRCWKHDLNRLKREYYKGGFRWPNY